MATSSNESNGDHGFQIAPMVDIVFVLLLFFMACAGLKQTERHLSINVPGSNPDRIPDPPLVVDIATDGAVSINGLLLAAGDDDALLQLRTWLARMTPEEIAHSPLIMRPTADTQHGRFVQVLSLINKAGFKKIAFA